MATADAPVIVPCPGTDCRKKLRIQPGDFGKPIRCPTCDVSFRITGTSPDHSQIQYLIAKSANEETKAITCPDCLTAVTLPDDVEASGSVVCVACEHQFELANIQSIASARETVAGGKSIVPEAQQTLHAGMSQLGRFKLKSVLGAGAFGKVYLAYDPVLDREVALKAPHPGSLDTDDARQRFLREPKAAAQLHHPHIVPIYDAGTEGEQLYIASAYVKGKPLSAVIIEKLPTPERTANIVCDLAQGVHYAHTEGIVHRDIKPANVMVDEKGHVHLMDFGLARRENSQEKLTHDGMILGTPAYMSPEQARKGTGAGPTSDQYSLGVMMYELLSGELPFSGPIQIVMYNVMNEDPPPLCSLNPNLPHDLITICEKAMSKEEDNRYENCHELAEELKRYLKGEPILARRIGRIERFRRWSKRNPLVSALVLLLFIALTTGATISTYFAFSAQAQANRAERNFREAENQARIALESEAKAKQSEQRALSSEKEARENATLAEKRKTQAEASEAKAKVSEGKAKVSAALAQEKAALAERRLQEKEIERQRAEALKIAEQVQRRKAEEALNLVEERQYDSTITLAGLRFEQGSLQGVQDVLATAPEQWKAWEWDYLKRRTGALDTFTDHTEYVQAVAFDARGKFLASASDDLTIIIRNAATGKVVHQLKGHTESITAIDFHPAKPQLVSASEDQTVRIWDLNSGEELKTLTDHEREVRAVKFAPNQKVVASGADDGTVILWDSSTWKQKLKISVGSSGVTSLEFTPDTQKLVTGSQAGIIQIWDVRNGREINKFKEHTESVQAISISPDGTRVVSGSHDRTLKIWSINNSTSQRTLLGHRGFIDAVTFNEDGTRIVSGGTEKTLSIWNANTGERLHVLEGHAGSITSIAYQPGKKRICSASNDNTVKLWEAELGQDLQLLKGHVGSVNCAVFNKAGTRILSGSDDTTVRLWNAESGASISILRGHTEPVSAVSFSPDGNLGASGSQSGSVKIWDLSRIKELATFQVSQQAVDSVMFTPDGKTLFASANGTTKAWDVATQQAIPNFPAVLAQASLATISPDGTEIASRRGRTELQLMNLKTGKQLLTFGYHDFFITAIAFHPHERQLISGGWDNEVKLWDLKTGKQILALKGHTDAVNSVCFNSTGTRIISASRDRTIRLWNTKTGQELLTLKHHTDDVESVAFSSDDTRLLSGGKAGELVIWNSGYHRPEFVRPATPVEETPVEEAAAVRKPLAAPKP